MVQNGIIITNIDPSGFHYLQLHNDHIQTVVFNNVNNRVTPQWLVTDSSRKKYYSFISSRIDSEGQSAVQSEAQTHDPQNPSFVLNLPNYLGGPALTTTLGLFISSS